MKSYVDAFASRDVNVVSGRLSSIYGCAGTVEAVGDPAAFSMSLTAVRLGRLAVARARSRGVRTTRETADQVHIVVPIAGTAKIRCGSRSCEIGVGQPAAVGRAFETLVLSVGNGAEMTLRAPVADVIERAERLTLGSLRLSAASHMADRIDLRTPPGRALERTMNAAIAEIVALDRAGLASVAVAGYEDLLVCHAAVALFPAVAARLGRAGAGVAPPALQRARDYIRENAAGPVEISRLVAELGIPVRTLQDQFRRYFGQSLRDWLAECRLESAHRALALPDGPTSVSAIAEASGFGNLGDFSVRYRKKYGVPPSETLRAARWGEARSVSRQG
jgi:AraC-like DNA-binding protein